MAAVNMSRCVKARIVKVIRKNSVYDMYQQCMVAWLMGTRMVVFPRKPLPQHVSLNFARRGGLIKFPSLPFSILCLTLIVFVLHLGCSIRPCCRRFGPPFYYSIFDVCVRVWFCSADCSAIVSSPVCTPSIPLLNMMRDRMPAVAFLLLRWIGLDSL